MSAPAREPGGVMVTAKTRTGGLRPVPFFGRACRNREPADRPWCGSTFSSTVRSTVWSKLYSAPACSEESDGFAGGVKVGTTFLPFGRVRDTEHFLNALPFWSFSVGNR